MLDMSMTVLLFWRNVFWRKIRNLALSACLRSSLSGTAHCLSLFSDCYFFWRPLEINILFRSYRASYYAFGGISAKSACRFDRKTTCTSFTATHCRLTTRTRRQNEAASKTSTQGQIQRMAYTNTLRQNGGAYLGAASAAIS